MKKERLLIIAFLALVFGGCTIAQTKETNSQTAIPTVTPTMQTEEVTPSPTIDEKSVIKSAIQKELVLKHGNSANELTITVSKIVGDYSSGGASGEGGGGMWFAAKVNNQWKLVWDGNGSIFCQDLASYPDYPSSLIPECYDQALNKTVKR